MNIKGVEVHTMHFNTMHIKLEGGGNPDFRQFTDVSEKKTVGVSNWSEAVKAALKYIEDNELGGGNWTDGRVYRGSELLGHVSYNGRCWDKGPGDYPANEIDPETGEVAKGCYGKGHSKIYTWQMQHDSWGGDGKCSHCGEVIK